MSAPDRGAAVSAGIAAGLAGLVAFLALHHAWIRPIWMIAPIGAVMAAGGGAIVGAAFAELLPRLPARPLRTLAVAIGASITLTPGVIVAERVGPIFAMNGEGGGTLLVGVGEAVTMFVVGLFGTAALTGAVLGALVGRSRRAAGWTALGGLALALGPGHNVPMLGATPAVPKELAILAVMAGVSALVLVEGHAWQTRRSLRSEARTGPSLPSQAVGPR